LPAINVIYGRVAQFNNKSELPNKLFIITTTRDAARVLFMGPCAKAKRVREREGDIKKQEKHFITKVSYFPSDALTAHRAEREKRRRYKFILEQGAALELLGAYLFIALERPSAA